jgi:hypothetical protein
MDIRHLTCALVIYALIGSVQPRAEESLVTYKSLAPETALDLARAALADCQKRGHQVAVAVVDRFGVVQVVLHDRYAGPHSPATASGKAWTAATFRSSTSSLFAISQSGMTAGRRDYRWRTGRRVGWLAGRRNRCVGRSRRGRRRSLRQSRYRGH